MNSMQDGKYLGRRFNRGVIKLGTLGHFHICLEDSEELVCNSSMVGAIGGLCWTRGKSFRIKFLMGINLDKGILRRYFLSREGSSRCYLQNSQ